MSQITIEQWMASLPAADQAECLAVWYDHVEKFNTNNAYTPHSEQFSALWSRFIAATTDE